MNIIVDTLFWCLFCYAMFGVFDLLDYIEGNKDCEDN
jgi:hypothetical protein